MVFKARTNNTHHVNVELAAVSIRDLTFTGCGNPVRRQLVRVFNRRTECKDLVSVQIAGIVNRAADSNHVACIPILVVLHRAADLDVTKFNVLIKIETGNINTELCSQLFDASLNFVRHLNARHRRQRTVVHNRAIDCQHGVDRSFSTFLVFKARTNDTHHINVKLVAIRDLAFACCSDPVSRQVARIRDCRTVCEELVSIQFISVIDDTTNDQCVVDVPIACVVSRTANLCVTEFNVCQGFRQFEFTDCQTVEVHRTFGLQATGVVENDLIRGGSDVDHRTRQFNRLILSIRQRTVNGNHMVGVELTVINDRTTDVHNAGSIPFVVVGRRATDLSVAHVDGVQACRQFDRTIRQGFNDATNFDTARGIQLTVINDRTTGNNRRTGHIDRSVSVVREFTKDHGMTGIQFVTVDERTTGNHHAGSIPFGVIDNVTAQLDITDINIRDGIRQVEVRSNLVDHTTELNTARRVHRAVINNRIDTGRTDDNHRAGDIRHSTFSVIQLCATTDKEVAGFNVRTDIERIVIVDRTAQDDSRAAIPRTGIVNRAAQLCVTEANRFEAIREVSFEFCRDKARQINATLRGQVTEVINRTAGNNRCAGHGCGSTIDRTVIIHGTVVERTTDDDRMTRRQFSIVVDRTTGDNDARSVPIVVVRERTANLNVADVDIRHTARNSEVRNEIRQDTRHINAARRVQRTVINDVRSIEHRARQGQFAIDVVVQLAAKDKHMTFSRRTNFTNLNRAGVINFTTSDDDGAGVPGAFIVQFTRELEITNIDLVHTSRDVLFKFSRDKARNIKGTRRVERTVVIDRATSNNRQTIHRGRGVLVIFSTVINRTAHQQCARRNPRVRIGNRRATNLNITDIHVGQTARHITAKNRNVLNERGYIQATFCLQRTVIGNRTANCNQGVIEGHVAFISD